MTSKFAYVEQCLRTRVSLHAKALAKSLIMVLAPLAAQAANIQDFPSKKGKDFVPETKYYTVVGSHRDIETKIWPLAAGGFRVHARFSQGEQLFGAHMCSAVNFLDEKKRIVGEVRQMVGINGTFGGHTEVRELQDDLKLSKSKARSIAFFKIAQAECPVDPDWVKVIEYISTAAKVINGS